MAWAYSDYGEAVGKGHEDSWTSDDAILLLDERTPASGRNLEQSRPRPASGEPPSTARPPGKASRACSTRPRPRDAPLAGFLRPGGAARLYVLSDDVFLLDLASSRFDRLTRTPEKESVARLSPDGRKVAFVRGNGLWVYASPRRRRRG